MNCALALRMLDAYVDDELDPATAAEMAAHLATCPACTEAVGQRVALRSAFRSPSLRHAAPPGLGQAMLRAIENAGKPTAPARSLRWWQLLALAGSTGLLGLLGGWWLAQPHAAETEPDLAVARHVASLTPAGPRIDVASSDRHVVRPWFQGRLEFAPMVRDLAPQGFDLLGARVDHVGPHQAVAVVYRLHGHVIDVFSWHGQGTGAKPQQEATIRGFNVVRWTDRDLEYAAVSDTDATELARFVAAYRAP
jgi:anti-sigma factor RsiW